MLILYDDDLGGFLETDQILMKVLFDIGPAQIVIVTFRLPVCKKWRVENDKPRMR